MARGTAPHPPPAASINSEAKPLRWREFRCVRGCGAVASLTEHDTLPDGWHVAVPAGKGDPVYTCASCAARAGLTVAPPQAQLAVAAVGRRSRAKGGNKADPKPAAAAPTSIVENRTPPAEPTAVPSPAIATLAPGAGELERRWDELHAQVLEWEALADVADQLGQTGLAVARREIAAEIRFERDELGRASDRSAA